MTLDLAAIRALTDADLAYMAEAGVPSDDDEGGAVYLRAVRDNVVERVESRVAAADVDRDPGDDLVDLHALLADMYRAHEWLDAAADALPAEFRDRWYQFRDLRAYEWVASDGTLEALAAVAGQTLDDVVSAALVSIGRHLAESIEGKLHALVDGD